MTAPYTTTDLNLAAFLIYSGVDVLDIGVQIVGPRNNTKAIIHFDSLAAEPYVDQFYQNPSPMVDLGKYNKTRSELMKRINLTKTRS